MRRLGPLLAALVALAIALAPAGCSRRERLNPLDPGNPQTGGAPSGFNAVAGYASVQLRWDPHPELAIDGFRLLRRTEGAADWQLLTADLTPSNSRYLDSGLPNSVRQHYRLEYVIGGQPGPRAAEDDATPGAARPWVADPGAGAVLLISPDGRDVNVRRTGLGDIYALAVDPRDGTLWGSARYDGLVWLIDPFGVDDFAIPGVASPYALAVSPFDHSVWVTDVTGGLAHFRRDGTAATPGYLSTLDDPIDVAVNPFDASVWVAERHGNRVRHYAANGTPLGTAFVTAPARVAVDSLTRLAWVTSLDAGRVWRIAENGAVLDSSLAANGPIGISIDRPHGRVWVADAVGARVLALDLSTLAVLSTTTNAGTPYDVAADPVTGEVWVVSRGERAVVRLAPDGSVLDRLTGLSDPVQVRLDPGYH